MTTNHPAHDPVSLVRLHQISEILSKSAAQSDGGNLGYAMADAVKVIDGAIAAFGAKLDENGLLPCPLCGGGAEFDYDDDNLNWISCSACGISTDTVYHTDIDARDKLREVWNRRTAMLQGKSAGNSPVVPDGWQLVPKEHTEAMNKAGWAAINEHDAINPTYRAMLAAAPQQEVK
ncbi:Lar family restriction alleviation protein [Citrobacter freundii]|uniref:Lar family restriction alleviation protein n=1 Tax=Citrobacter freundii TaxID=546 RepID=UPI0015EAD197|nr:Lar family restriction alleviation protein [Citrobacter freundii]QLX24580.1 Lar family restriction alleviation protein [Citrobacter freundii]